MTGTPHDHAFEPHDGREVVYAQEAPAATLTDAVSDPERIGAIDLARGIALLGIFLVNMQLFAMPFGAMMSLPGPPEGASAPDAVAYYFVLLFCAGKFYPLFSMLFGIGFMVQLSRAQRAGRKFVPMYLRRLAVLFVLGLAHALLLWYGDILFIYSFAGLALFAVVMLLKNISAKALAWTGIVLILISALTSTAVTALLGGPAPPTQSSSDSTSDVEAAATTGPAPATQPEQLAEPDAGATQPATQPAQLAGGQEATPPSIAGQFFQALRDQKIAKGPADPLWMEFETRAYRDGSYLDAFAFRAMSWLIMIAFTIISGFGLHVLGMFFLGAAIYRGGGFDPAALRLHRRFVALGALVGLPLVAIGVFLPRIAGDDFYLFMSALNMLGGPMMSLAYLGAAALIAASGAASLLVNAISRVGRMALSNYLSETLIATFLMYNWGLGWFGSVGHAQQVLIVLSIYAGLLLTSSVWLSLFRFGPMEWLWRTLTYLKAQPLLRR